MYDGATGVIILLSLPDLPRRVLLKNFLEDMLNSVHVALWLLSPPGVVLALRGRVCGERSGPQFAQKH